MSRESRKGTKKIVTLVTSYVYTIEDSGLHLGHTQLHSGDNILQPYNDDDDGKIVKSDPTTHQGGMSLIQ